MTKPTPNKLNVDMPAGYERGLRGAVRLQIAVDAGFTRGSLAARWMR